MSYLALRNVSVDFPIYRGGSRSLKKTVLNRASGVNIDRDGTDQVNVRALRDLTLDVTSGERVGLVGRNGAGKTTLLKVLGGIYEPTLGRIATEGRISSLMSVSLGLDVDATGYENIALRGLYLDVHPRRMMEFVDEIAAFTELGEYLDMPVRAYSSGMMVRLAFAISTCFEPDILIMDEWVAAGDAHFLKKAQDRLSSFVQKSRILVLASHSVELLQTWCTTGLLLDKGQIVERGPIKDVVSRYRKEFV